MDRSYLYGDGLFETVRVEHGRVHRLSRHVARFRSSAEHLGFSAESVAAGVDALEALHSVDEDGLWRVTVSRSADSAPFGGHGSVGTTRRPIPEHDRPRLLSLVGWYLPGDPLGHLKSTSYQRWVEARRLAQLAGADDALLISKTGLAGETSTSNIFVRIGELLLTPPVEGLLPGVTRAAILEHASEIGIDVREAKVTTNMLETADELICTSAGLLAASARSLDGRELAAELGPVLFERLHEGWP